MNFRICLLFMAALLMSGCGTPKISRITYTPVSVSEEASVNSDAKIDQLIGPYREQMKAEMDQIIGEVAVDMPGGRPESLMGNFVSDVLANRSEKYLDQEIDFAISNAGGLRIPSIPAGPLQRSTIYELLPFDNVLVVLSLTGKKVQQLADHIAEAGGWPVSGGFAMVIAQRKAARIRIQGKPLDPEHLYRVAMPDYVANGGDNASFLTTIPQESTGRFMRDAVLEYIAEKNKAGEALRSSIHGRISIAEN
jgi:2',3'-cyclic-nucleotide 2'-phosphodiesterase (5'-nucleotidase family)